jgi:tRNA pseudouridine38-40 synthase
MQIGLRMSRIALGLEYDGSAFCGWQTQTSGCSVQDVLERALSEIAGASVTTICAGRTDAGVHALAQVAHFDAPARRPQSAWVRGVNALLPAGACVLWAKEVDEDFHSRYGALSRTYVYYLLERAQRPALLANRVGWFHLPLSLERMQQAANCLLGEHDFSAFRAAECQASSPVRTLLGLQIERRGALMRFELRANAFLQHMARNIVGSLVYVGSGRQGVQWMRDVLESRDRNRAAPTFPAAGLYLWHVEYPERWQLPAAQDPAAVEAVLSAG